MKITVDAKGNLRQYIEKAKELEINEGCTLGDLKAEVGIPASRAVLFTVNRKMYRKDYVLKEGDNVMILNVVGAG